jgi:4-amino-4-deoxy-L-arabinose transferase-like glycosyltransferase
MKLRIQSKYTLILALLFASAAWKVGLALAGAFPFNSDEAVVALMARHILQGERPVFFYGQAYMGSLDAFLVAGGFWLLGEHIWVIRLVQGLLYLGVLLTTIGVAKEAFGSIETGILAAGLLAIPTVNMTLYTTVTLGGYGEALLIGNLILIGAMRIAKDCLRWRTVHNLDRSFWLWVLGFGFLSGFGLWTLGLTGVYVLPALIFLAFTVYRLDGMERIFIGGYVFGFSAVGFLIGAFPWWVYALQNGLQGLVGELLGSAVAVEQVGWLARTSQHLINLLLLGLPAAIGLRPPWAVRWLALPLAPLILAAWAGLGLYSLRVMRKGNEKRGVYGLLTGVGFVLGLAFIFTAFGVDPSGRYFLPLGIIFAILAADAVRSIPHLKATWIYGALGLAIVFNIVGTLQCAVSNPPGITTQFNPETVVDHRYDSQLTQFLLSENESCGYSDYWVSYPLAFVSGERLIFVPRLPYHADLRFTPRDDRYPPYDKLVRDCGRGAYITTNHALLDDRIRKSLTRLGVTWQEKTIGDYLVYYHLSQTVAPMDLAITPEIQ